MKSTLFSWLKLLIGWPLSILALIFIFKRVSPNFSTLQHQIQTINIPFLLLSLVLLFGYFLARGLLWQHILFHKEIHVPLSQSIFLWAMSEIKRFLPGNIWALVGRTSAFSRHGEKKVILSSMLLEGEFAVVGSAILSSLAVPIIYQAFFTHVPVSIIFLGVFLALFGITCFLAGKHLVDKITHKLPAFFTHFLPLFHIKTNLQLTFIACVSFLCFGLGTFFAILSITPLPLQYIILLSTYFSFSFFVGYASIIAPMGLGVREGAMTAGLALFLPLPTAAIAAIFARIVLIGTELVFLSVATLWKNIQK